MKNQYIGDVGDYGKYGLLRFLAASGVKIGVNWYLTENDQSNDGKKLSYLDKSSNARYDPILFAALKKLAYRQDKNVSLLESENLIPDAKYFSEILRSKELSAKERYSFRNEWHQRALKTLTGVDSVFCDPDNGSLGCKTVGTRLSEKYVSLDELADYYNRGQNIIYYSHKARRNGLAWEKAKHEMLSIVPDASIIILTFHGGTQRSYIFVVHPDEHNKYRVIADGFLKTGWKDYFSEES